MKYTHWEAAANRSKSGRAVSTPQLRDTPKGLLLGVIVIGHRIQAHWAYASADGIAIPPTYGKPKSADIDAIREWKVG